MQGTLITTLSENRVRLDGINKLINKLPRTRYTASAATAVELGRMYMGEVVMSYGGSYPYEATKEATTPEGIQEAVDTYEGNLQLSDNEIVNINKLRELIVETIETSLDIIMQVRTSQQGQQALNVAFLTDANITAMYTNLKEGRMWLGKRLGEIKDASKQIKNGKPTS